VVAAVFQLEHSRTLEDFATVVKALAEWLTAPEQRLLNEDLTRWIQKILLAKRLPGMELEELTCLQELTTMLSKRIDEWTAHWKAEGYVEGQSKGKSDGWAEGLAKGRTEGRIEVLLRLLEEKFGPLAADIQNSLYKLEENTVLEYVKRTFTANSVQEVLGPK
jgi:flagellar biosynthesis/type III secretory pathway protein FliH